MHKIHEKINYLEFPVKDIAKTKAFFSQVFSWEYEDFGPEYTAFTNETVDGGFFKADLTVKASQGSVLIVFYSEDLEQTQSKIEKAGGEILQDIFIFPGGRRFHFSDLNENEYAVWSDLDPK